MRASPARLYADKGRIVSLCIIHQGTRYPATDASWVVTGGLFPS